MDELRDICYDLLLNSERSLAERTGAAIGFCSGLVMARYGIFPPSSSLNHELAYFGATLFSLPRMAVSLSNALFGSGLAGIACGEPVFYSADDRQQYSILEADSVALFTPGGYHA